MRTLSPWDQEAVYARVEKTGRVIVAYVDSLSWRYGAEIAARIADECFAWPDASVKRVASTETFAGYAPQWKTPRSRRSRRCASPHWHRRGTSPASRESSPSKARSNRLLIVSRRNWGGNLVSPFAYHAHIDHLIQAAGETIMGDDFKLDPRLSGVKPDVLRNRKESPLTFSSPALEFAAIQLSAITSPIGRPLTPTERSIIDDIFQSAVDAGRVRITETHILNSPISSSRPMAGARFSSSASFRQCCCSSCGSSCRSRCAT